METDEIKQLKMEGIIDEVDEVEDDIKENFINYNNEPNSITNIIIYIFYTIVTFIAIYYSFQINKGFNFGAFLLALIFSPIYLLWGIYKIGFPPKVTINKRK